MEWRFGTSRDVSTPEELRAELSRARDVYCASSFKVDPFRDEPTVQKARQTMGESADQSGQNVDSVAKAEARAQMDAAIDAAVDVAARMPEGPTIIRVSLYGHASETRANSSRVDEVTIVINRAWPEVASDA